MVEVRRGECPRGTEVMFLARLPLLDSFIATFSSTADQCWLSFVTYITQISENNDLYPFSRRCKFKGLQPMPKLF